MLLPDAIRDRLDRLPPAPPGLVVAVSGGADSVALLRAIVLLGRGPLIVAHLNHGLRGAESDADEQFVRDLHAQLSGTMDARLAVGGVDLAHEAAGANLEAAARKARYRFLAEVAREHGVARVATGHTADDQAETVLHRLLRGTGLQGLRGIAARRPLDGDIELVRPMLEVTRADVLAFLAEIGQPFREDRSNLDRRFTRNRIRHELLPLLRTYNPGVVAVLGRLAEQAAELFEDVRRRALELLRMSERPPAGPLRVLDAAALNAAPRNLRREALRQLWQREGWPRDRMRRPDWDRVAAVAAGELTAADLPGRIHARRRGHVLQVGPQPQS